MLADLGAGADAAPGRLATILQVLRRHPHGAEGIQHGPLAHLRVAVHHHVADEPHASTQFHVRPHGAPGADLHPLMQAGAFGNNGGGVDHCGYGCGACRSMIMAEKVASATDVPFTVPVPWNRHTLPRLRSLTTWSRSWSPGTTGRRNFALSMVMK